MHLTFSTTRISHPPVSKLRQVYLEGAVAAYVFGVFNRYAFKVRGDRRGRPGGGKAGTLRLRKEFDDACAASRDPEKTTVAREIAARSWLQGRWGKGQELIIWSASGSARSKTNN